MDTAKKAKAGQSFTGQRKKGFGAQHQPSQAWPPTYRRLPKRLCPGLTLSSEETVFRGVMLRKHHGAQ